MQIYNSFFISQIKTPIFFSATEKYLRGRVVRLKIYCYFCCRNAGVPGLEAGAEMIPLTPDTDNADTGSCRFSRILHMLPMRGLRVKTRVPLSSYSLGKNIAYGQTTLPGRTVYSRFRPLRGAGIQADIKTCAALGVYAMTALTALTAQNTLGVRSVMPAGPAMLRAQLEAVLDDITPDAVKVGMVPDAASAKVIAGCIETYRLGNIVLDPVMAATSGHSLAGIDVLDAMRDSLFPLADIITPNLPEASAIASRAISRATTADALCLLDMTGAGGVLLKGAMTHRQTH